MARQTSIRLPARLLDVRPTGADALAPHVPPLTPVAVPNTPAEKPLVEEERAQVQRVLSQLTSAVHRLDNMSTHALEEVRGAAIDLAIAVTSRFLMQEVNAGRFPVETLVDQALERLAVRQAVSVLLHPEDLSLLQKRCPEGMLSGSPSEMRWLADPRLPRGACRLDAADRSVLFDPEQRLAALREALTLAANADETANERNP